MLPRYGFDVAGTAATAEEAVATTVALAPNATLLDMAMTESATVLRMIAHLAPGVSVVALGIREQERHVLSCIEAGAAAYVTCQGTLDDLVDATKRAIRGEPLASPRIVGILMRRVALASRQTKPALVNSLTSREFEVIRLIDDGLSNKEIAVRLSIEVTTVKNHVHNILEKLGVRRRGEAAARVRGHHYGIQQSIEPGVSVLTG